MLFIVKSFLLQVTHDENIPAPYERPARQASRCFDWLKLIEYDVPFTPKCPLEPGKQRYIILLNFRKLWRILKEINV